jgi:predicted secreted protein
MPLAQKISALVAIYFVMWWIVLFAVLPFGVRSQHEEGPPVEGTEPGAPVLARMARKLLWTTVVTTVIFGTGYALYAAGYLSLDRVADMMGVPKGNW